MSFNIPKGIYSHYKGKDYEEFFVALNSRLISFCFFSLLTGTDLDKCLLAKKSSVEITFPDISWNGALIA